MKDKHGNFKDKVGLKNTSNEGLAMTITVYRGSTDIDIQFEDGTVVHNKTFRNFEKGMIKNPNIRKVFDVGYKGVGNYSIKKKDKNLLAYSVWHGMLRRCYCSKSLKRKPTYKNISVCEEWLNYQNFAKWFYKKYRERFELDKDILCPDCKIYSPETCCFVPPGINILFISNNVKKNGLPTGVTKSGKKFRARLSKNNEDFYLGTFDTPEKAFEVYKFAKEAYIKEVADIWKSLIEPEVYKAMYNHKIILTYK